MFGANSGNSTGFSFGGGNTANSQSGSIFEVQILITITITTPITQHPCLVQIPTALVVDSLEITIPIQTRRITFGNNNNNSNTNSNTGGSLFGNNNNSNTNSNTGGSLLETLTTPTPALEVHFSGTTTTIITITTPTPTQEVHFWW